MIQETNRIFDPRKQLLKEANYLDMDRQARHRRLKHNLWAKKHMSLVQCTKCKRWMSKKFGELQIHYGKKNAPICIPCIEGKPRRKIT